MSGDAPAVKDLPKIEKDLKSEITSEHKLKPTEVAEKNVLPSAEDLKAEKAHEGLLKGVEGFTPDKLKPAQTREPATPTEVMKAEITHDKALKEVSEFNKDKLSHVDVQVKNPLPDKEAIKLEAEHQAFVGGIEDFDKNKLKHTPTVEKNTLPTSETIAQEKMA